MCVPCLFHPSNEVRMDAIELVVNLYMLIGLIFLIKKYFILKNIIILIKKLGEDIRDGILAVENLKPNIMEMLIDRMDKVKDVAEKN